MMESAPTTEAVYQGVYTLYNNSNTVEQEKASKWLEQLQNSVSVFFSARTIRCDVVVGEKAATKSRT